MLVISLFFLFIFLWNSFQVINVNAYDWDLDQFMYSGSRILMGELPWTREFDDKAPLLHYIFAIPAFFKDLDVWILINIFLSLIGAFCLFSITNRILKNILEKDNRLSFKISILTASIYLLLLSANRMSVIHINIFCTNLIFISKYLLLEFVSHRNLTNTKKLSLFILAAILGCVCISIRPYFFWTVLSIGIWIILRNKSNFNKLKIIRFSIIWTISIGFLILILNFLPYLITNNFDNLISTIQINSFEYGSDSTLKTLGQQYKFLKSNPIIFFSCGFFFILFIFRDIFREDLNLSLKNENLLKFDIDIIFISIIFPLLIEISILSRHFFPHYMTFFAGYASISIGLFLGLFMKIYKNKYKLRSQLLVIFLVVFLIANNILISPEFSSKKTYRDKHYGAIASFIENERYLNKEVKFLFPLNNYFHWKLSESRHGFPMAAVYRNISRGDLDGLLKKFPNLKPNYIMTDSDKLCNVLLHKGPDLIFTRYKDKDGSFTFDCLKKSREYDLDESQDTLTNINWFVFRSNKYQ